MTFPKFVASLGWWWVPIILAVSVLLGVLSLLIPWGSDAILSRPDPVRDYPQAMDRISAFRQARTQAMNPEGNLQLLTHGQKTGKAIILVHGYTNGPQQFALLGKKYFEAGCNVLLAPLPHHGLADRMNTEQASLSAAELAVYTDEVVDIAQGLGEKVHMMGISAGGVCTAWAAQNRGDLALGVIVSPAFGYKQVPTPLTVALMNLYLLLPDGWEWWDPALQLATPPDYGYPRYSKHALMEIVRLANAVRSGASRQKAAAGKIILVLNDNDQAVNNELARQMAGIWHSRGTVVEEEFFTADLGLGHDLIDPNQPNARIDLVYPRLLGLTGD